MPIDITAESERINSQISALKIQEDGNGELDESNYPYVIFQVFENKFAISCKYVVSIEKVTPTTEIVNSAREIRGVSYYKNEPISVVDLRAMLGVINRTDYINNVINLPQRIKDHEAYAQTLENCVNSGASFTLNTDPHKCAFGKWFYATKMNMSFELRNELNHLEPFHNKFHETAQTVKDLLERGNTNEAAKYLKEVEILKDDIISKLNNLNDALNNDAKELNIVLQLKGKKIGLLIDNAESVEEIYDIQQLPPSVVATNYIKRLGLSKKEQQIILILEAAEFANY